MILCRIARANEELFPVVVRGSAPPPVSARLDLRHKIKTVEYHGHQIDIAQAGGSRLSTDVSSAPHNIEAEQALLGAILVNNEALYRVSDFLEPQHFFEPIHQQTYDVAHSLIRTGKLASPVTLKTFLPAEIDIAGLTLAQYLARLAAEATTIINAVDYGRTVYDLAIRRELINIGEDMVNVAFDAPVDFAPRDQIEDAERRLYELAEIGRYGGGFQKFETALTTAVDMAARAYQREESSRASRPASRTSTPRWAACRRPT